MFQIISLFIPSDTLMSLSDIGIAFTVFIEQQSGGIAEA